MLLGYDTTILSKDRNLAFIGCTNHITLTRNRTNLYSKYIPGIYLLLYIILTGITTMGDEMSR